ncbi:carbon storage regulator [Marinobacter sp. X15-166B]|uniref:carbon storage regulator n=1 Tax=Marinobacter sp. X15-166B TaxID=1897620 RepID=UPI00085C16AB|nr:carbon storage regulator [Marinobacter sp. X15-166B]OEY66828.1 hypothetical protein BG841_10420 [Marinobacter sp. X15-166B]
MLVLTRKRGETVMIKAPGVGLITLSVLWIGEDARIDVSGPEEVVAPRRGRYQVGDVMEIRVPGQEVIEVVVMEISGSVRIGFDAAPEIAIDREEIYRRKLEEVQA